MQGMSRVSEVASCSTVLPLSTDQVDRLPSRSETRDASYDRCLGLPPVWLSPDVWGFVLAGRINLVPTPFPAEFRADVIAVARKGEAPLRQIAKDFGISEACLHRWPKIADREDGRGQPTPPANADELAAQLREAHKRIKLLEQEAEVMRRAVGYLSRDANPQ